VGYRFADGASTVAVFAGFAVWALFTVAAERNDLRSRRD
jgi:hypothetical protein